MRILLVSLMALLGSVAMAKPATNMQELLAQRIITLDRPLMTFHYRNAEQDPNSAESVLRAAAVTTDVFFRRDIVKDINMAGPGLYVAVDPGVSRMFGFDHPQLYVVTLKKGTRVLDARYQDFERVKNGYSAVTDALQCLDKKVGMISKVEVFRNSKSLACQEAAMQALTNLNVGAILYQYAGAETLASCRGGRGVALNVISPSAIEEVSFFSRKYKYEATPEAGGFVKSLFEESMKGVASSGKYNDIPDTLKETASLSLEAYNKVKSEMIWKCGPVRSYESGKFDRWSELYHQDGELGQLVSEAQSMYQLKSLSSPSPGLYFSIEALRGFQHFQYRNAKLAEDDSKYPQWLQAGKIMNDDQNNLNIFEDVDLEIFNKNMRALGALLEEKPVVLTVEKLSALGKLFSTEALESKIDFYNKYIGRVPSLLLKIGYGPRVAALSANRFLFPGRPLILTAFPMDPNTDYSSLVIKNQEYLKNVLTQCIADYKNPAKTFEEIQASDCGLIDFKKLPPTSTAPQAPVISGVKR
jgi:hypothetical protein